MKPALFTFLILGLVAAWFSVFTPNALAQTNAYGSYTDEHKSDKTASLTILLPENERIEKSLKEYSVCPVLTAECQACTTISCSDLPSPPCSSETKELGAIGEAKYLLVHFKPDIVPQGHREQNEPMQICEGDEAAYVVIEKSENSVIPIIKIPPERMRIDVQMLNAGERKVIQISHCVFGTGGCSDELYLFSEKQAWIPLERDDSWNAVYDNLPSGYHPHKTVSIDFNAMHWARAMATDKDANCCPSGRIDIDLSIKNDRLHVDKYKYETSLK